MWLVPVAHPSSTAPAIVQGVTKSITANWATPGPPLGTFTSRLTPSAMNENQTLYVDPVKQPGINTSVDGKSLFALIHALLRFPIGVAVRQLSFGAGGGLLIQISNVPSALLVNATMT